MPLSQLQMQGQHGSCQESKVLVSARIPQIRVSRILPLPGFRTIIDDLCWHLATKDLYVDPLHGPESGLSGLIAHSGERAWLIHGIIARFFPERPHPCSKYRSNTLPCWWNLAVEFELSYWCPSLLPSSQALTYSSFLFPSSYSGGVIQIFSPHFFDGSDVVKVWYIPQSPFSELRSPHQAFLRSLGLNVPVFGSLYGCFHTLAMFSIRLLGFNSP